MKLQLALDSTELSDALALLEDVADLVDVVEVGTPLVLRHGAAAIEQVAGRHRTLEVLADFKIMDAGDIEAGVAFEAGADIVTVLGAAHDATIAGAVAEARRRGRRIMVDLMAVGEAPARAVEVVGAGADLVCVHTAYDLQRQGVEPLRDVERVHAAIGADRLAVAGGVTPEIVAALRELDPAIVVVGGYIARHAAPRAAARAIRDRFA